MKFLNITCLLNRLYFNYTDVVQRKQSHLRKLPQNESDIYTLTFLTQTIYCQSMVLVETDHFRVL